jgi:hypothetical protein
MAAGAREHLAQAQVQADVLGLQLERLAVVQDRLVVLLRARVRFGEGLVGAQGRRVELHRLLQRGGRVVRVALGQVLRAELDVGLEAARADVQEPLPGRDGLVGLLELRIDVAGQDEQGGRVRGGELDHPLVFDRGLSERLLVVLGLRLHVAELGQDEVRLRRVGGGPFTAASASTRASSAWPVCWSSRATSARISPDCGSSRCALRYSARASSMSPASRACWARL